MLSKSNTHIGHSEFPDTLLAKCFFPFYCNLIYNDFISTWFSTFLYSFIVYTGGEGRLFCKKENGDLRLIVSLCRSAGSWVITHSAGCQETVSLVLGNDQLRWQMASAGWQVGDGEIGSWKTRKTKIKLFALTTFSLHDYF